MGDETPGGGTSEGVGSEPVEGSLSPLGGSEGGNGPTNTRLAAS